MFRRIMQIYKWVLEHLCHMVCCICVSPCSVLLGICVNCYFFICLLSSSLHKNHHALPVIILMFQNIQCFFFVREIILSPEFAFTLTVSETGCQATSLFSHFKSNKWKKLNFCFWLLNTTYFFTFLALYWF